MKKTAALFIITLLAFYLQSCMMLNPVKRQPLTINEYSKDLPALDKSILIHFTPVVSGKPLDQTIWDNMRGPLWDVKESIQIGFTQDYQFTPIVMPGVSTVATTVRGTRIVVPFGNAFVTIIGSAASKSFGKSSVCLEEVCIKGKAKKYDILLTINVDEFKVFESPMNHINFLLKATSHIQAQNSKPISKQNTYTLKAFKLGSIASTSYGFISKMNEALNQFTEEAVSDLLSTVISDVS